MGDQVAVEAIALWEDAIALLEQEVIAKSTLEMMRSCQVVSLDNGILYAGTSARFVYQTLLKEEATIERALSQSAYQTIRLHLDLMTREHLTPIQTDNSISMREFDQMQQRIHTVHTSQTNTPYTEVSPLNISSSLTKNQEDNWEVSSYNLLKRSLTQEDSRLTFDRFIEGQENAIALAASKQVANGENKTYNPLFIYGKSGLGKTHLLKAIHNYILTNDQTRMSIYRTSTEFRNDYTAAMVGTNKSVKDKFEESYKSIDVLIIDDIQYLKPDTGTLDFFFELFNYLIEHGKQIVLAADRTPYELGLGVNGLDERITSRIDSGFSCPINAPAYELKSALIQAFYNRMKEDAIKDNIPNFDGTLTNEDLILMAERAGSNIRIIEGFCQACLLTASRVEHSEGRSISREEIIQEARRRWPEGEKRITIGSIQRFIESEFSISHNDLIGNKRTKELMRPRHIAIWLSRELTDSTLLEIGERFGGRSHATVKHSIGWVENQKKKDRTLRDQIIRMKESLVGS